MSLTVFVHRKLPEVGIVEWFRNPKSKSLYYPDAPLHRMEWGRFRSEGYDWVHRHFEKFENEYIIKDQLRATFGAGEEKKFLKQQRVVFIHKEKSGELRLNPLGFKQYNFGGFDFFDKERWRIIAADSSPDVFWRVFDEVLADAP